MSGIDHEADYQALSKDGGFTWIRDVVHVIRNGEDVEALVGFMFDISERKRLEQALETTNAELHKTNEALREAMRAIKAIGGIIPVCAWCGHRIRTERAGGMDKCGAIYPNPYRIRGIPRNLPGLQGRTCN